MSAPAPRRFRRAQLIPLLALFLYWSLAAHQLSLPGLYYDEALDLPPALDLAQGRPARLMPHDPGVTVLGRTLPLMILDYLGTVSTYLTLPLFAVMGANWVVVRFYEVATGIVVVALGYRLARTWFGASVGGASALLLAVSPSFIFWSRMGISVSSVMAICSLGSLIALTRWKQSGRDRWLGVAGLLLGVGLWAKFLFLWWLNALGAAWVVLEWRRLWPRFNSPCLRGRAWAWGGAGFALGAGPLFYYNLRTGNTLAAILRALQSPTDYGVDNLRLAGNFRAALDQLRIFLDGSYFWYLGDLQSNAWALGVYLVSLLVVVALMWRWPVSRRRRAVAVLVLALAIVGQSAFTVSGIWATHLFILAPLPQVIVALAASGLWELPSRLRSPTWSASPLRWLPGAAGALLLLGLFAGDLATTWRYHLTLGRTGGYGRFSDAVYALADYLDRHGISEPAALDWGVEKNIFILTNGRVQPQEIFGYSVQPDEGFRARVQAALCEGCAFVNVDERFAVFSRERAFREIAAQLGYEVVPDEEAVFRERSGQVAFVVYRVRRAP
jgi:hypothetical protein